MALCLTLCLEHGADRGLVVRWLFIRKERLLVILLGRRLVTCVQLSMGEDLERFDDNFWCVPFLAILVIPRAVGEGAFDKEGHTLMYSE